MKATMTRVASDPVSRVVEFMLEGNRILNRG